MSKSKVAYEKKLEIVRDYLEGAAGLLPNSRNNVYSAEVKRKALQEYLSGYGGLESVCEKYEIRSTHQLYSAAHIFSLSS